MTKKLDSPLVSYAFFGTMVLMRERNGGLIFINDRFTPKSNPHHALIFKITNILLLFALIRWIKP